MTDYRKTLRWPTRAAGLLSVLAVAWIVGGCVTPPSESFTNGQRLLQEGRYEDALKALEQAANEQPPSAEYRMYYQRQREIIINQLLLQADDLRRTPDLAEAAYRRVLNIDSGNARARAGLEQVQMDRRHKVLLVEGEQMLKARNFDGAAAKVRTVLAENPNNAEGRVLLRLIDEQRVRTSLEGPVLKSALSKPLSIEFREANLKSIFEVISRAAGINFVFDRDVRPDLRATIMVKDMSIEEVIRVLLVTNQLEKKVVNDNTVMIYPNTPAKQKEYQELVVKTFYLTNADAKQVLNLIRTIVKTRDVYIDEKLNLLVMRDTPEAIRLAEKLVANQDLAEPEVMLEVEVMEIKRSTLTDIGLTYPNRFEVLNLAPSQQVTTSSGSVVATTSTVSTSPLTLDTLRNLTSANIAISPVVLNLRSEASGANLLANPRIRVKNREKAKIHIGDRVPVITTTSSVNLGVAQSVTYLDIGLRLEVEPIVSLDNEVGIKVGLEVSNIVKEVTNSTGLLAYQIGTRTAATNLRLRDGETQVLAGLIADEDRSGVSKVPGLGDLPVVGRLFANTRSDGTKTEIILLITPRVMRNLVRPEAAFTEFSSGTESAASGAAAPGRPPAPALAPRAAVPPASQPAPAQGVPPQSLPKPVSEAPPPPFGGANVAPFGGSPQQ